MSTTPTSTGNFHSLGYYKSRTAQIFREASAFSQDDIDHELGPELDLGGLFAATSFELSDTPAYPRTSRFACDSMSNRTSTMSSSRTITPSSILITPSQTPQGLHPTSVSVVPSPLCLGPSLHRTHPENDLEDVCLDDGNSFGELPELVTPQITCDPITNRSSTTSSILITPPQTPPGPHPTSFPAVPSPLCLGPSLCRTHPENDLEDVCLDEPFDDGSNVDEDDELPELVTRQTSCFPSSYHCDLMSNRTSTTSSSRTMTPSSILITPFQTPLCLGPSLCRTHPDNDLEDLCLDEPFDDVGEDDELPELVTPVTPSQTPLWLGPSLCRTHPENDLEDVYLDDHFDDGDSVDEDDELLELVTPETSCFPSTYYHDSRTSATSSSSTLITPPQTPLGPHPTSFPAVPSPLCLGPSLRRTRPDNDLEDVCLDEPFDDGNNVGEDDERLNLSHQSAKPVFRYESR